MTARNQDRTSVGDPSANFLGDSQDITLCFSVANYRDL
jgi:hypothetical protein